MSIPIMTDHDLLITLNTKVDGLSGDMKDLKEGISSKVAEHETRIRKLEDIGQKFDPTTLMPEFSLLKQQVHDFKTTALAYRTIAGIAGGAIFFALTQIPNILKLWRVV